MTRDEQAAWLAQVTEEIIDPARRIVDPHHHFWRGANKYGPPYLLEDLWADTGSGHSVEATVYMECRAEYRSSGPDALKPLGETEFVMDLAKASREAGAGKTRVAAMVGHADLRLGAAVRDVLEAQRALAGDFFKGIRHGTAADADAAVRDWSGRTDTEVMRTPEFRAGFAELSAFGMSFDAWLYHPQIPQLTELAHAHPDTTVVLDHFGGPLGIGHYAGRRGEVMAKWRTDITELARCPNVFAKIGGLAMPVNGWGWHDRATPATSDEIVAAHRDWYMHTIDAFGPDRCMFESNFPVDKLSVSYGVLWNAFKKIAETFTDEEKDLMFYKVAKRVYRL